MRRPLLVALLALGLLAGCDDGSRKGAGEPLPPSKDAKGKDAKGKVVADDLPTPPKK